MKSAGTWAVFFLLLLLLPELLVSLSDENTNRATLRDNEDGEARSERMTTNESIGFSKQTHYLLSYKYNRFYESSRMSNVELCCSTKHREAFIVMFFIIIFIFLIKEGKKEALGW